MESARRLEIAKRDVKKLAIEAKTAFLAEKNAGCDEEISAIKAVSVSVDGNRRLNNKGA